jgi:hypothetical protein
MYMEGFPYLNWRGLKGLDGVASLWSDIGLLTDGLFDQYMIPKRAIEASEGNWPVYRQQVLAFLGLPSPA